MFIWFSIFLLNKMKGKVKNGFFFGTKRIVRYLVCVYEIDCFIPSLC